MSPFDGLWTRAAGDAAGLAWDWPWALLLLPLVLWPWWRAGEQAVRRPWQGAWPQDAAGCWLDRALRLAASLAIGGLVLAVAGPYRPAGVVSKMGQGAEIVIVLDRSRSMDQPFGSGIGADAPKGTGPEALAYYATRRSQQSSGRNKGQVARELLTQFVAGRPQDRYAFVLFSTMPLPVLPFTGKTEAVQAAIAAGDVGRGLADTDIGLALQAGLKMFEGRPYQGSRLLMLVSDGGDHIDPELRERLADTARRLRVGICWLYIRSALSPGLMADASEPPSNVDTVPEYFLHRWFQSIGMPYRAYQAEDPEALKRAIEDVDRLENLPIQYDEAVPRQPLGAWPLGVALTALMLLLLASGLQRAAWEARS